MTDCPECEQPTRHSVNCYYCGQLVDERTCVPNTKEHGGNEDGGSICPECLANCPVLTKEATNAQGE